MAGFDAELAESAWGRFDNALIRIAPSRHMSSTTIFRRVALAGLAASFLMPAAAAAGQPESGVDALSLAHIRKHPDVLPVVVVVAQKEAVLSDFVVPYGVLAQSGAAKVISVNLVDGPLDAGPLTVVPDMTASEFDRAYPGGADVVIVPATADVHGQELAWLRAQRGLGAALVSICDGVELLAEIGVLDGRRATGHWASLPGRRKDHPQVKWDTNIRYVADGDVASSAGVSASLPISLALVEAIAGPQVALETAARLGVGSWNAAHDSDAFTLRPADNVVHLANMRKREEVVVLKVHEGDDEVALSLHAEAWSRTMRDTVRIVSDRGGVVRMRGGLRVQTQAAASVRPDVRLTLDDEAPAGTALGADLERIAHRHGPGTARLVALGMEYPWGDLQARH